MAEQHLDLFKFASGRATQLRASSASVVRGKVRQADFCSILPQHLSEKGELTTKVIGFYVSIISIITIVIAAIPAPLASGSHGGRGAQIMRRGLADNRVSCRT